MARIFSWRPLNISETFSKPVYVLIVTLSHNFVGLLGLIFQATYSSRRITLKSKFTKNLSIIVFYLSLFHKICDHEI